MSAIPSPANRAQALEMMLAGARFLSAADATDMMTGEQAECMLILEYIHAMTTAARASILAAFTAARGHHADADYSPRSWLINRLRITKGAATAYTTWARRTATHPRILAALAAAEESGVSESMARTVCDWTDKLPKDCRDAADGILITAARAGANLRDLADLAGQIYAKSRPQDSDGPEDGFDDRSLRLETTFAGAGVMAGDLTPECAAVVAAVLDALSAPAGADDTRTHEQRYHDALQDAMQRLLAAGLLPERAGQPVKGLVHMTLAELRAMDKDSALEDEWITAARARWAGARAAASVGGSDGSAWLDGDAARAVACDAMLVPVVTGDVDPACSMTWSGCAWNWPGSAAGDPVRTARTPRGTAWDVRRCSGRSSARPSTCCQVLAGWPASCASSSSVPGWPGRASRWISGTPRPSRPESATR